MIEIGEILLRRKNMILADYIFCKDDYEQSPEEKTLLISVSNL